MYAGSSTSLLALVVAAVVAGGSFAAQPPSPPVRLIFDTDIQGDADDVGTVAVLHALADAGETEILAMGVSSKNPWSPLCLSALNVYFGRGNIPLGVLKGPGSSKASRYARQIAEEFPRTLKSLDDAPDASLLYRRVLAAADQNSVVIVSVGFLTNLRNLLVTKADKFSPLDGRMLVASKVRAWVCMGGQFPEGREACNMRRDAPAAAYVIEHWPTAAVFSGGELGVRIQTGARLARLPASSPVRRAYELFNGLKNRASWDQTAVLYGVRGLEGGLRDVWGLRTKGSVHFDRQTAYVKWRDQPQRKHSYLVEKMPPEKVAGMIEALMLHQPTERKSNGAAPQPLRGGDGGVEAGDVRQATATTPVLPFTKGSATIVVVPDTEVYANKRPHLFEAMFKWIAGNITKRNIVTVLHVGDITNRNTDREWKVARRCYDLIEGKMPYVLAAGNHDYDGTEGRLSLMNKYFHASDQKKWQDFGDVFEEDKLENHYQFVEIHGRKWIILSLEMGPRKRVLEWANKVLAKHRGRRAIILTHGYLYYGNQRYNHLRGGQRASPYNFYGEGADGEMLWNSLVRRNPNTQIVQCGHLSSGYLGYRADEADYGNIVHQMMVDYEKMKGGYGYLRLLEFLPDGKTVQVRTYSPVTKKTNPRDPKLEEFTFELQGPTRKESRPVMGDTARLSKAPIHRYSFGKVGEEDAVRDSVGTAHGRLEASGSDSRVDPDGRLLLAGQGRVAMPDKLIDDLEDISVEVWVTPTSGTYNWSHVFHFGTKGDQFYYTFRTLSNHRAEIIRSGRNEKVVCTGATEVDERLHIVMTYDRDGAAGTPVMRCYRNGEDFGALRTGIVLQDLRLTRGRIGPFEGVYDEFRVYDYPLSRKEIRGNFSAGPGQLNVDKTQRSD